MRPAVGLWLASLAAARAVPGGLRPALQALIEGLAKQYGFAVQLAWKSADEEFGLAAGDHPTELRPVTAEDTFAFGSGTKPYTAALLLRQVEQRRLSLDDPVARWVDPVLWRENRTTLAGLFGELAGAVTVGQLLRMQSGLADFDVPDFDAALLARGGVRHSPFEFLRGAAAQRPQFLCAPGNCTSYSSTNYVLAGFVALAAGGKSHWTELDQRAVFPASAAASYANSTFVNVGRLGRVLTVAGLSEGPGPKGVRILAQDASILGWTCGNLVAAATGAARFFHDLLLAGEVLAPATVKSMQDFRPLDLGWAKGAIQYGTGLMIQQASWNASYPPVLGSWGSYVGHGGDTYGFLSEAGVLPQFNASFAVIANEDYQGSFVKNVVACRAIETAARVLRGEEVYLRCGLSPVLADGPAEVGLVV